MLVDYHIHALGHRGGSYSGEGLEEYFAAAVNQGITEIGLSDHNYYLDGVDPQVVREAAARFPGLQVRLGLEFDYRKGWEPELAAQAVTYDFDYLIGSVHHIGEWMFDWDDPEQLAQYDLWEIPDFYNAYFNLIENVVGAGLFDIVGHLDLCKVFGYRPSGAVFPFAQKAMEAIARSGMVVEVNTAGLRKPCEEIYPAEELLVKCFDLNIPVTMGSDAHEAEQVGMDLARARELMLSVGYRKLTRFAGRRKTFDTL